MGESDHLVHEWDSLEMKSSDMDGDSSGGGLFTRSSCACPDGSPGSEEISSFPGMQFHLLSFEGPDGYSRAGGIASRIEGLARTLAGIGFEAHLWFIGDPSLPGHESSSSLHLHRWCQWISRYYPGGVYDGEEAKRNDLVSSLPPYLFQVLERRLAGRHAVILAEEWQTADAVLHLDRLLHGGAFASARASSGTPTTCSASSGSTGPGSPRRWSSRP
jgi:hypothetical protein